VKASAKAGFAWLLGGLLLSVSGPGPLREEQAHAQVGAVTLGVALDRLMGQAQDLLERAKNAGNALEIEAGRQAFLVLGQAKVVYKEILNTTVDKIDSSARKTLNAVTTSLHDLESNGASAAQIVLSQLQTVAQLLPFHDHQPKIGGASPSFAVLSKGVAYVRFSFHGSFEFAGRANMKPMLNIGGSTLQPSKATSQDVEFMVPASSLAASARATAVTFVKAELTVPWVVERWIRSDKHYKDSFPILVGLLPTTPGGVSINEDWQEDSTTSKHMRGPSRHVGSRREEGNNDQPNVRASDNADPGCSLVGDSVKIFESGTGTYTKPFVVSRDNNVIVTETTTIHKSAGSSGVVDYWVEFDELCPIKVPKRNTIVVNDGNAKADLRWGDRRSYTLHPGAQFKVIVDQFDGKHLEYSRPSQRDFVTVGTSGDSIDLATADPRTLSWP
jgi:hypothetical protein